MIRIDIKLINFKLINSSLKKSWLILNKSELKVQPFVFGYINELKNNLCVKSNSKIKISNVIIEGKINSNWKQPNISKLISLVKNKF